MAMSVLKDRPPPLGTRLDQGKKGSKSKPPKIKRALKESIINQIQATPPGRDLVVDMTAVRSAIQVALQQDKEDTPPFQPSKAPTVAVSGGGSGRGEVAEWHPSWQFKEGEPAWVNLLRNAHHMKPVGRKFIPDPNYTGKGESPLPQRDAPYSAIQYDNVVPFEDALDAARVEAQRKSDNSFRARGSAGMFDPVVRDYQKIAQPSKEDKGSGEPVITKLSPTTSAHQQEGAANSQPKVSTLVGDTTSHLYDIHLQALWYLPVNIAMELNSQGYVQLSPSYEAWYHKGDIKVGCNTLTAGVYEVQYTEMDFLYLLENGANALIPQDMEANCLLSDMACEYIFSLSSPFSNEFMEWDGEELIALWNMHDCSHRNHQAFCPMNKQFTNPPPNPWDEERWREQHKEGLLRLGFSWIDPEDPTEDEVESTELTDEQADNAQHQVMHREYLELMALTSTPWMSTKKKANQYQDRWDNLYSAKMERLSRSDEHRYQLWLAEHLNPECDRKHCLLTESKARQQQFFDSVPVVITKTEQGTPMTRAVNKVRSKVKGFFGRVESWLMTPVITIGGEPEEVAPKVEPTSEEIRLASKAIYNEVMKGSLVEKDNRETIQWLQQPGRPLEDIPDNEFTQRVVHVIQNEKQEDLYSATGIYLGKKSKYEQVHQGSGMMLLNAKVPPEVA